MLWFTLRRLNKSTNIYVRQLAIRELEKSQNKRAISALCKVLVAEKDSSVRFRAVQALQNCKLSLDIIDDALATACRDADKYVRISAVQALAQRNAARAAGACEMLLNDEDASVRLAALNVLENPQFSPEVVEKCLLTSLLDEECVIQIRAIQGLVKRGIVTAVPRLVPLLRSSNSELQVTAIGALGKFKWEPPELREKLLFQLCGFLAAKKGELLGPESVPALVNLIRDGELMATFKSQLAIDLVAKAAIFLSDMGGPQAVDALIPMLKRPYDDAWIEITKSLRKLRDPKGAKVLVVGGLGMHHDAEKAVTETVADIGDEQVIPYLVTMVYPRMDARSAHLVESMLRGVMARCLSSISMTDLLTIEQLPASILGNDDTGDDVSFVHVREVAKCECARRSAS